MSNFNIYFLFALFCCFLDLGLCLSLPVVITTWPFVNATSVAWSTITSPNTTSIDAVEAGCSQCEIEQCNFAVGWGSNPDEKGETTLDAMIMDGKTRNVGGVGALRRVTTAISVARAVMERTTHTLLVGDQATDFALQIGFTEADLHSNRSIQMYTDWKQNNCQPNFWKNVKPDPTKSCGPYKPTPFPPESTRGQSPAVNKNMQIGFKYFNHDTIGMVVIDDKRNVATGTTTNGLNHKIPGRVGDTPIMGAGSYADNDIGGAACTGNGDFMMRFLPSFHVVSMMKSGLSPGNATLTAIQEINRFYPGCRAAIIAVNTQGQHGVACSGMGTFHYTIHGAEYDQTTVKEIQCIN
ncbi:hypothetical protein ACF0H5_011319 [Mactra antiquata]